MLLTLEENLAGYFRKAANLSRTQLVHAITKDYPSLQEATVKVYLSKLKKLGVLFNPSRGVYSLQKKADFRPAIEPKLKSLYKKIQAAMPYASVCVWDTKWLNSYMRHQPFKYYTVVEADKDVLESLHGLFSTQYTAFIDPDTTTFGFYVAYADHAVILRPLVSEAPLDVVRKVNIPSLEKLMVDMLIDTDLFAAQQSEIQDIFKTAFERHTLNIRKMKRYAMRRNRGTEIERLLNRQNLKP